MKIKSFAENKSFFWLLVPAFFILKNATIYFMFIPIVQIIELLIRYLAGTVILYFVINRMLKQQSYKAALYCFVISSIYFFFDALSQPILELRFIYPFNKYRYIFILFTALLLFIFFRIRRLKTVPQKTVLFLNLILTIFCLLEGGKLIYRLLKDDKSLLLSVPAVHFNYALSTQPKHPNIYFLLFDEYLGNQFLQSDYNYNNEVLKTFLTDRNFFIPKLSRSNYNYTSQSMPSILNMNYLEGEMHGKNKTESEIKLLSSVGLIQNANVITFLKKNNYRIINLSPFNVDDSLEKISSNTVFSSDMDLIQSQTFINIILKKFGWYITNKKWLHLIGEDAYGVNYYNNFVKKELVKKSIPDSVKTPKFVYTHFFMPHFPFLKDSLGKDVDFKFLMLLLANNNMAPVHNLYLSYVKYVNTVLMDITRNIIKNDPNSIIMIMSDHGFRMESQRMIFNNQFYIRTPDVNYSNWPDTIDAVNAFRLLFNNEFNQKLDYLPYRTKKF
jgi:hypothetical protein